MYLKPLPNKKINSWDSALKKQPLPEVNNFFLFLFSFFFLFFVTARNCRVFRNEPRWHLLKVENLPEVNNVCLDDLNCIVVVPRI